MKNSRAYSLLGAFFVLGVSLAQAETTVTINMIDKTYDPTELKVSKGTKVIFHNGDGVAHNVVSADGPEKIDLKLQKPGEDLNFTFNKTGTYPVGCDLHPKMKINITVE